MSVDGFFQLRWYRSDDRTDFAYRRSLILIGEVNDERDQYRACRMSHA